MRNERCVMKNVFVTILSFLMNLIPGKKMKENVSRLFSTTSLGSKKLMKSSLVDKNVKVPNKINSYKVKSNIDSNNTTKNNSIKDSTIKNMRYGGQVHISYRKKGNFINGNDILRKYYCNQKYIDYLYECVRCLKNMEDSTEYNGLRVLEGIYKNTA